MRFILRWLINALALILVTKIVSGFHVDTFYSALIAALVIGLLNAIIRPVLILLTLPITIVTLGLFTFVINALIIWFTGTIVKGFTVDGFLPALMAALILWAVSTLTNWMLHNDRND
ncbi:phage holin family protein [Candidatus Uhrbacteria bacterium]|nr:phage holin family protein [Candidatus Uhrbacteria bacterium]